MPTLGRHIKCLNASTITLFVTGYQPENHHIRHPDEQLKLNNPVLDLKRQVQDLTLQALQQHREEMEHYNSKIQQLKNHILRVENENTDHKEELLHLKAQLKSQELYTHDKLDSYKLNPAKRFRL